jgi:hypothetical protein
MQRAGHDFHGRDFHGFTQREREVWLDSHWRQDWRDDGFAWRRVADGGWYSYAVPAYPYPTYVPTYVLPAIIVQQAPPVPRWFAYRPVLVLLRQPGGRLPLRCFLQWAVA